MRVLIVEDSKRLRQSLGLALRKSGYAVDAVADGKEGIWLAESIDFDAIILDLMLPKLDGLSLLAQLRKSGNQVPVLVLTARETVEDRVRGLQSGADDYLTKPFALAELLARIDSLVRRKHYHRQPVLSSGQLTIETATRTVRVQNNYVTLSPREYRVLEFLAFHKGSVVSRKEIEDHTYDENTDLMSNVVDSTICTLRKKLADLGAENVIRTLRGHGYILDGNDQ